jgi:hypothetical protein
MARVARQFDPEGPADVRQTARAGPTAVMRAEWRDPDDMRPNAQHKPREITGYRTYCPLRRMAAIKGSQVTDQHIYAADILRGQIDLAVIGRGGREMIALQRGFGPVSGPSANAVLQVWAAMQARRALTRLAPAARIMLTEVVLFNRSIHAWCAALAAQRGWMPDKKIEMGKLIAILDILADHYAAEIDEALARGTLLG